MENVYLAPLLDDVSVEKVTVHPLSSSLNYIENLVQPSNYPKDNLIAAIMKYFENIKL